MSPQVMNMSPQVMDIVRGRFLESQLDKVLPLDVINIIRSYDSIYRDNFSKNVISSLNINVNIFWETKMMNYTNCRKNMYNSNYIKMLDYYYYILRDVLIVPSINYNDDSCGLLFIVD